jgi:hypothetical protein
MRIGSKRWIGAGVVERQVSKASLRVPVSPMPTSSGCWPTYRTARAKFSQGADRNRRQCAPEADCFRPASTTEVVRKPAAFA